MFAWTLWTAVLCMLVISVLAIYSAKNYQSDQARTAIQHGVYAMIGLGAAGIICLLDYKIIARWSGLAYGVAIILLGLVLVLGVERFGAKRWLNLGFFQFQPSEPTKLAFILFLARFLSVSQDRIQHIRTLLIALIILAVPVLLILAEPDLGSSLVFFPVSLVMMFMGGIPKKFLIWISGMGVGLIAVVLAQALYVAPEWQVFQLEEYQKQRLLTFFNIDFASMEETEEAKRQARELQLDLNYNVRQALISVGSGGMHGKGWLNSEQVALDYLPRSVAHNDFIFSVIAEEKGFVGSVLVIALYSTIMLSGLYIASQSKDLLGKLLASGIITLWLTQIFINIGMNIGLMPVTGLPLPLLSYGGTATISALASIGILQNVYIYRKHI